MVKFKIDYDETDNDPAIVASFNTASVELEEKLMRRFKELADTVGKKIVLTAVTNPNGTTSYTLKVVNV